MRTCYLSWTWYNIVALCGLKTYISFIICKFYLQPIITITTPITIVFFTVVNNIYFHHFTSLKPLVNTFPAPLCLPSLNCAAISNEPGIELPRNDEHSLEFSVKFPATIRNILRCNSFSFFVRNNILNA